MKVAILCGGRGTRIREISEVMPKPMVPIGDRPILWHVMKIYSSFGFNDFVLLLGYKGSLIREYFLNFAAHTADVTVDLSSDAAGKLVFHNKVSEPWKVTLVDTGENSLTGARLVRAQKYLDGEENFCLTYGDGVGNVNVAKLVQFHQSHGKVATVTGVQPPGRFGELSVQGTQVRAFNEKPQASGGFINGGFFVFNRRIFKDFLNAREDLILEKEPMEKLSAQGELQMHSHSGFWQPMDTPREFQYLNELWNSGKAPWKLWS